MKTIIGLEKQLLTISSKIRAERIALDLTQKEFAEFIDLKYATYRSFEQDGKISLENFLKILKRINKDKEFEQFLNGFEFDNTKERVKTESKNKVTYESPIISHSTKQITLDKNVFGNELFYSVENGQVFLVSVFISILLSQWNDKRLMLLLKYFGVKRLKPYILKEKNIELLKAFRKHESFLQRKQ